MGAVFASALELQHRKEITTRKRERARDSDGTSGGALGLFLELVVDKLLDFLDPGAEDVDSSNVGCGEQEPDSHEKSQYGLGRGEVEANWR